MQDDVQKVKRNLPNLEDYVQSHGNNTCSLTERGSELRGAHPVHGSDTGSNFAIDTDAQVWYCHRQGHKTGGDIFNWIAVDEGIVDCSNAGDITTEFPDILEIAADKANVDLELDAADKAELRERREERELIRDIYDEAAEYYQQLLTGEKLEWVKDKYGLEEWVLEDEMVGYAPDSPRALIEYHSASERDLLKSGLVISTSDGIVDVFDGRVVFPYLRNGKPRYWIGRKTPWTPDKDYEKAKYKKIPMHSESHEYVSEEVSEPVYGIDHVRGKESVIVTEGVTDVLAAYQHGYPAIAPVTTQFKKDRIRDVARQVDGKDIYVIMDSDDAGMQGALKTARSLDISTTQSEVYVGRLPEGDICDFVAGYTPGDGQ